LGQVLGARPAVIGTIGRDGAEHRRDRGARRAHVGGPRFPHVNPAERPDAEGNPEHDAHPRATDDAEHTAPPLPREEHRADAPTLHWSCSSAARRKSGQEFWSPHGVRAPKFPPDDFVWLAAAIVFIVVLATGRNRSSG